MEESRTNMIYPSQGNFSSWAAASWVTVTDNSTTSPDGTQDASTLTATAQYGYVHDCSPTAITTSTPYISSAYVKPGSLSGRNFIDVEGCNATAADGAYGQFSPTTGACLQCIANTSGTCIACGSQTLANGWYRMWVEFETTSATQGCTYVSTGYGTTGSLYMYGAQLELGAFPTSYIPTSTASVTRPADVFTLPTTAAGANGAWYTAGTGTLSGAGIIPYASSNSGFPGLVALDDGTSSNAISLFINQQPGNQKKSSVYLSGSSEGSYVGSAYTSGALTESAITFNSGTSTVNTSFDGVDSVDLTSITIPTLSSLRVGGGRGGSASLILDGWVNRIWYMPTPQPDASMAGYTQ